MHQSSLTRFFRSAKAKFPGNYFTDLQITRAGKQLRDLTSYDPTTGNLSFTPPLQLVANYEDLEGNGSMIWLTLLDSSNNLISIAASRYLLIYSLTTKSVVNTSKLPSVKFIDPNSDNLFALSNLEFLEFKPETMDMQAWVDNEIALAKRRKTMDPAHRSTLKISPTFGVTQLTSGKFMARYKQMSLGTFEDPCEAAETYLNYKIKETKELGILDPTTEARWKALLAKFKLDPMGAVENKVISKPIISDSSFRLDDL